jgi:predicted RNase H-like nuclease
MSATLALDAPNTELLSRDGSVVRMPRDAIKTSSIDISDLTPDQYATLSTAAHLVAQANQAITTQMYVMAEQLQIMLEILGKERFYTFANETFGFNRKRVERMFKIHRVLDAHFSEAQGKFHPHIVQNISNSALLMLADDTDSEVVDELKELSKTGKVTETMVRSLLEQRKQESDASIKALNAELDLERRRAREAEERAQNDTARLRLQAESQADNLRRVTEERDEFAAEYATLEQKLREIKPTEKIVEKEVVPEGYSSVEEAVSDMNRKLREKSDELRRKQDELEAVKVQETQVRQRLDAKRAGADTYARLQERVEELLMMFPTSLLASVTEADPEIKSAIQALGKALTIAGGQLQGV